MGAKAAALDLRGLKKWALGLLSPVCAILISFFMAGIVVLISGGNPLEAYGALLKGAFGSAAGLKNTVRYTLPIIMLALSFSLCDRCGYFNIGQEGQMFTAALAVAWVPQFLGGAPAFLQVVVMVLLGALVGGVMSLIPALLKFLLGINEIVIGVLLNYIASLLSSYMLLHASFADPNSSMPMSYLLDAALPAAAMVGGVILIVLVYGLGMQRTVPGYELRMIGKNPRFSKACGLPTIRIILIMALIGGAFSGLAAVGEVAGVYHKMYEGFAAGMGYNGMTAALIGKGGPVGMVFGSLILGALQSGSVTLSVETSVPAELVQVVQGFVMFFATVNILRFGFRRNKKGGE